MMTELERRWKLNDHPGAIRGMLWLDSARMFSFAAVTPYLVAHPPSPDTPAGAASTVPPWAFDDYRYKWGFGLNLEQEITKNVGVFSRLGWNDGHEGAWTYTDANWAVSTGVAIKGAHWHRPDDTLGIAGVARRLFPGPDRDFCRRAARASSTATGT